MYKKHKLVEEYLDTLQRGRKFKVKESTKFTHEQLRSIIPTDVNPGSTSIEVVEQDTLLAAEKFFSEQPLVLNMASDFKPGGGVEKGSTAQEESLFRRTNYAYALTPDFYPLKSNEVVYSPDVTVFKDDRHNLLNSTFTVSMVACAAIRNPKLVKKSYSPEDRNLMKNKIRAIFNTALIHGHKTLILGALGCGAFNNPPEEVAIIYKEVIAEYPFFNRIIFAVLGSPNYPIFKNILSN